MTYTPAHEQTGADATDLTPPSQEQSFSRYVIPELDSLSRLALSLTGQPADAEDLVQDTLLRAYRSIGGFDGAHPRAWLFTIMRRTHLNNCRRARHHLSRRDRAAAVIEEASAPAADEPEHRVVDHSLGGAVTAAFSALPTRYQEVVRLVDIAGLDYHQAAEVLGIPVGTVTSRLYRARTRLRGSLTASASCPNSTPRGPDGPRKGQPGQRGVSREKGGI